MYKLSLLNGPCCDCYYSSGLKCFYGSDSYSPPSDQPKNEIECNFFKLKFPKLLSFYIEAFYEIEKIWPKDVEWSKTIQPANNYKILVDEAIFVICNSGMKAQIATKIFDKIQQARLDGLDIGEVFGHKLKVRAIKGIIENGKQLFEEFEQLKTDEEKLNWCGKLDHIGEITKYHLAKNLGVDCAKPDRHLVRIANAMRTDVVGLCEYISKHTGQRIHLVDYVLWRAANQGWI